MENDSFYKVLHQATDADGLDNDDSSEDMNGFGDNTIVGNCDTTCVRESILKSKFVQEHWKKLNSSERSLRLLDAVKKHVYTQHFGDDGTLNGEDMTEDYDPLIFKCSVFLK